MRNCMVSLAFAGAVLITGTTAFAASQKAGLWEVSSTTTWQRPVGGLGGPHDPASSGRHTKDVCLTQEMIDKYGALMPQPRGQCRIEGQVMKNGGTTARWVCSGKMKGEGTLETDWTDMEHGTGTLHFRGTIAASSGLEAVEWTTHSTSVFKSSSCGDVKPDVLPTSTR